MADRQALQRRSDLLSLADRDNDYFGPGVTFTLYPNGVKGEIWISDGHH